MVLDDSKDYKKIFIVFVFALFWISILLTGLAMVVFGEKAPMQLFVTICSWTPTFVLLIMFKKLVANTSRIGYFRNLFREKINWGMLLTVTIIQLSLVLVCIWILSLQNRVSILSVLNLSLPVLSYGFFTSLITGATGEESAWRGYLFPVMVKESGVIKSYSS